MPDQLPVEFHYRFGFDDGDAVDFDISLDPITLDLVKPSAASAPPWAAVSKVCCSVCELDVQQHPTCPVAASLAGVVDRFGQRFSYEKVDVEVTTAERIVRSRTSLQHALSSLTGIYMVTSGCPTMDKLRPMVRFHLPLATLQETTYRAASMYLLGQYLHMQRGGEPDWTLDGLEQIYAAVHQVNLGIARCIRNAAKHDANANALVRLDLFTDGVAFSIQEALGSLTYLFENSYLHPNKS